MKVIPFYGMRRSGNHAIIEWIHHSISDGQPREVLLENTLVIRGNVGFINDCANRKNITEYIDNFKNIGIETTIINYEDVYTDTFVYPTVHPPFVIIRDIPNVVASRIKRGWGNLMTVNEQFFNMWEKHSTHDDFRLIKYETWLTDKGFRDKFILNHFIKQNLDKTDFVPEFGLGSSFVGYKLDDQEKLLNRDSQIEIPEKVLKMINSDQIKNARKKLGYL